MKLFFIDEKGLIQTNQKQFLVKVFTEGKKLLVKLLKLSERKVCVTVITHLIVS